MHEMAEATGRKKRSFDASFKLKVIDYALSQSNRAAVHHFRIDEKRVQVRNKRRPRLLIEDIRYIWFVSNFNF